MEHIVELPVKVEREKGIGRVDACEKSNGRNDTCRRWFGEIGNGHMDDILRLPRKAATLSFPLFTKQILFFLKKYNYKTK